ncbi:hypothetical protein P7F88_25410 [Vibrio hannami]|uniref:hypothetical protein n=1 Tax=Vibrio hannami TaxID=2717094 RepID=UPI00240FCD02|nr:hypothetical protein [Vibrio hannami]MDG3089204.1 hypothetical protein [Vibrio hannami]
MTRPLILALLASPAFADDLPSYIETNTARAQTDALTLEAHTTALAHLTYTNHAEQVSVLGDFDLEHEGFTIRAVVKVRHGSFETITVITAPGFIAIPPYAEVQDGDAITIAIMPALF